MIKYHAQFLLDKEKNNPTAKVRYRIKWNGNIVAFNIGFRIEIDKWNTDTQRCNNNTSHGVKKIPASTINRRLNEYETICVNIFEDSFYKNKIPSKEEFRENFNIKIGKITKNKKEENSFFDIFDLFTREESIRNQWTYASIQKFQTLKNHLQTYNTKLDFKDLTEEGLFAYQIFTQEVLNMKNSTIIKHFSFLRWFLRWTLKKGYNTEYLMYQTFRPKLKTTPKKIIFLTQNELKKLINYKFNENQNYLERVRDVFLFQCFTGLRYSDVQNLKKSDIKNGSLEITTIKTADSLIIELNNYSQSILNKYENFESIDNKALPVISNQKMNDYLKELGELVEIDEPIKETFYKGNNRIETTMPKYAILGTHAGRRTFICNALSLGIPVNVVMKWTGHSDYKAMKPYIDIADDIKATAMEKFNLL